MTDGQILAKGVRKAYASKGDDTTLTRFVKVKHDEGGDTRKPRHFQPRLTGIGQPAFVVEGRTKFPGRVLSIADFPNLLVSGHSNVKIGRDVRKGKLRGYWIYYLSLEERKTCPESCKHWQSCYGNNMPFARRIDHTDPVFYTELHDQVERLVNVRGREGVLIRLHALGDFFDEDYVRFWANLLYKFPTLAVYGYTARQITTPIGYAIQKELNIPFSDKCLVRFSDGGLDIMSTVSIGTPAACPPNAFICPEQTGKTRCCATCALCWSTVKNVAFLEH